MIDTTLEALHIPTTAEDDHLIVSLRAQNWEEFFGQEHVKESLSIAISAAKGRKEPLDHTLFYGPPGLGKTTLAHIIARELGSQLVVTSGTALSKAGDLAAILTNLQPGDVLFIDEIHRLPKVVEETLYPAMEDYALDIVIGKGPAARTIRLDLPQFTLIGATTRFGLLAGPFRDRFGLIQRLRYYEFQQLSKVLQKAAKKLNIGLTTSGAESIAKRSRGTPRIALKLLKRVRDYVEVDGGTEISPEAVDKALDLFAIDILGLGEADRRFLIQIIDKHQGGPIGLSTISATLNEDAQTIEEVLEPYLIQLGFMKRTPQGRVITKKAYDHVNRPFSK
ncbi:MAG: Holliday junction branch migration DNA helicase RuvB [Microgenomates group bacterium]